MELVYVYTNWIQWNTDWIHRKRHPLIHKNWSDTENFEYRETQITYTQAEYTEIQTEYIEIQTGFTHTITRPLPRYVSPAEYRRGRNTKLKISPLHRTLLYHAVGSNFRSKSLYLLRFSRYWHFLIFRKNPRWPPKVAKIEIPPLCTRDSCSILRVKNSLEIALSLTVFEILTLFHFPQKSKMADESGENWNFPPLHRRLLYHPVGQKFARNRSICYGFRDIDAFSFSTKIQDGRRKWRKLKFPSFAKETLVPPCGSKIRSKSLFLLRFSRYWLFFIFRKNPRWPPKVVKIEIFLLCTGDSCTTLRVKNSLEIVLSLTVFEILTLFHFPQKSKMAVESGENWNFPPLHRRLLYHPVGQKFARNRSISYGFRDIDTFPFSAKIQDGQGKWRKLKFFPFAQDTLVPPCGSKNRSKSLYLLRFSR